MTFEQELQQLVTKYGLQDVEVSYKHKITLSANTVVNVKETPIGLVDEVKDEEAELARIYAGGPIGKITT